MKIKTHHLTRIFFFTLAGIFTLWGIGSCKSTVKRPDRTVNRSFYYWKSVFRLSAFEKQQVEKTGVNTIYIKFFDVDWNDETHTAIPLAQIRLQDVGYLRQKEIIPTVFITNECIFKTDSTQADSIGTRIARLVNEMIIVNGLKKPREIQIDCDWTKKTKDKYFAILKCIRSIDTTITISATIRLHQVKFMDKTGIPPVEKGMLMCYNMGNLKDPHTRNSIIETSELKKYIDNLSSYPLPLDVALPVFEWSVLLRNDNFVGLMQQLPADAFNNRVFIKKDNRFEVTADTVLWGYSLKKGDVIRYEKSGYDEIMSSAAILNKYLPPGSLNVSLYHLDSLTLSKYPLYEMENIYNSMR